MIVTCFAAGEDQVRELRTSGRLDPAAAGFPRVDVGGLSPYALVTLDAAVTGDDADAIEDDVIGRPLEVVDDGEQLLWAVRSELAEALADLAGPALEAAARQWAETEEMSADGVDASTCEDLLGDLVLLARQARSEGLGLYTWLCV